MSLALEFVAKSSVILVAGLCAAMLLSRASATFRHFVLVCTLLAVILVLPLSLVLPGWHLRMVQPADTDLRVDPPSSGTATGAAAVTEATAAPGPGQAWVSGPAVLALWTAGAGVGVLGLGVGLARLGAMRRRAVRLADPRWGALAADVAARYGLRRHVQLFAAAGNTPPATWGVVRPRIVVPRAAVHWDAARAQAVLAHELAHVARFDWATQLAAELARAALWWHPLMWMLASRLRCESELACDDRVLDGRVDAAEYAAHLLDIARTCRTTLRPALPIARLSTLERRIAAMLTPALNRSRPTGRVLATLGVLCLLVTAGLGTATLAQTAPRPLVGTVYDPTGAVAPEVSLTLTATDGTASKTSTDSAGRFQFPVTPPGRFELQASMPGFRSLSTTIELRRDADWDRTITLQVGTVRETITVSATQLPAPPKTAAGPTAVRVGGNIRAPRKLKHVSPVYPAAMRAAGIEGTVPLEAIITAAGTVQSVRILSATVHPELALAAVDAVRQWQFEPTLLNGSPVDIAMSTTVTFTIDR
jgi:TonB family protein